MKNLLRTKVLSVFILLGGLFIALSLVSGGGGESSKDKFLASIEAIKSNDPLLAFEKSGTGNTSSQNTREEASTKNRNLTDSLSILYLGEIAKKNPNVLGAKTLTLPEETKLEELIASQVGGGIISKTYGKNDIKILNSASKDAERLYLENIFALAEESFGGKPAGIDEILTAALEKENSKPLRAYLEAASKQIASLLNIEAPKSLASLHIETLNLWEKKISVYGALLELETDPMAGYLALQSIESIISENELLQKKFDDVAKKTSS